MAFPETPIIDTFDNADIDPLNGVGIWNAGVFFNDGALKRASNQVVRSGVAGSGGAYTTATYSRTPLAVELYATCVTLGANFSQLFWCAGGVIATVPDGYYLTEGLGAISIYRIDAGVSGDALATYTQALSNGDSFGIHHDANGRIQTWYKAAAGVWTLLGVVTDTTYSSGSLALEIGNSTWDNIGGGQCVPTIQSVYVGGI